MADVEATRQALQSAQRTPIAELQPEISKQNERLVEGEVTISWPFSIVTRSVAFKLVESDFRLRMNNGQVRVDFYGAAGKAVAKTAIGGGDEVQLSLEGVEWVKAPPPNRPDTLEWQLKFTNRLRLKVKRADDGEEVYLDVDGPDAEDEEDALQSTINTLEPPTPLIDAPAPALPVSASASVEPTPSPLLATPALPTKRLASSAFDDDEYASPAFLKRTRLSHGGFWEGDLEDFDDERKQKKKKRRSRFSMVEKWTYSSRTPSPEPEARPELEEPESEDEEQEEEPVPSVIKPSPTMVDEGVQTRIGDKVTVGTPQPPENLMQSPGPPSSPTPAGIPEAPVVQLGEESVPAPSIQEEPRQESSQPNPFAAFQPSFGQSQMQSSPPRGPGFGSGTASGFGSSSGFVSQAPFGAAPAFGMSARMGPPSSSAPAFGTPSGVGFSTGFGPGAGSTFGANNGSGFGTGFGISNGAPGPSAPEYPEPPHTTAEEEPIDELLAENDVRRLYKANEFYSAPADYGNAQQSELQDELQGNAGDFTHDIATNVPAFAPSQLEQASWGTLTSLPPQSHAPEPNNFENPVELLSSSPPRGPSRGEGHDTREFDDRQPETSDVEAEEGEHFKEEGYMQVDPVPEDAPVESDNSPTRSQVEETDDNRDGGDVAGEDYDLRNYDDAQEDDVVESDNSSEQLVDKSDPDQQVVDFEDEDEDESDIDEEEELEYTTPGRTGHGLSDEPGEFDGEGEMDDEQDYGEEYSEEEEEPLDYDEEVDEPPPFMGGPAPSSSKEPVFIDLLSDSDDDEAPAPAPAALPTAAVREREDPELEGSNDQDARLSPSAEAAEDSLEAGVDRHSEASHGEDGEAQLEDRHPQQAVEGSNMSEERGYDSNIYTPPSQRSSPPPIEDEDLGLANAPFAAPLTATAEKQEGSSDADVLNDGKKDERAMANRLPAQGPSTVEAEDIEMQDRDDGKDLPAAVETQGTSDAKHTQTSVSFESQPRNIFDFAASATQDVSQPEAALDLAQEVIPEPEIEEPSLEAASAAKPESPIVGSQVEVTEVIEVREQDAPVAEGDVAHSPDVIVEEATSVVVDVESPGDDPKAASDDVMADASLDIADGQRHRDSSIMRNAGGTQSIDQPSAPSLLENQTTPSETQPAAEALQTAEQDVSATGVESLPAQNEPEQADNAMKLDQEADDNSSEREFSLALEQQIMSELGDSQRSQAEIPSIEEHETNEPTRRVTRSKAKQKPERDILITEKSLRSWSRKSMSSIATDEDPSFALARAGSEVNEEPKESKEKHATPEPRQPSQSQASPQSIRVTRSKNHDDDPSLMLADETPQRKGHKGTPTRTRETRSSVAPSAEPEEQSKSQTSTQTLRATRNKNRDEDQSLLFADAKESQSQGDQSSAPTVHATRSKDIVEDPSLFLSETTPRPRKIRGEVTPEPELGSERSLRSKTPDPSVEQSKSPSVIKGTVASAESSFVDEDETIASLKLKLSRELRSNLADCIPLSTLRNHINENPDILGVVAVTPEAPTRPKSGPRDYMMELLITDPASASSSSAVSVAHLFRPHQTSLPSVAVGDVILLRHFNIRAMKGRGYGLRSGDGSSWAVWEKADTEGLPQIKGPPVELGEAQGRYAQGLRKWWDLVEGDEKLRDKLERKTQQVIKAGRENRGKGDKEGG